MKKRLYSLIRIPLLLGFLFPGVIFGQATTSVLSQGQFYKIAVSAPGIYKLDAAFLSNTAGINLSQTPAQNITLWTNGGGLLPQLTTAPRIDDLREVAMYGQGTADGKVDGGDYFLFFAEGADQWDYNETEGRFRKTKNIYDNANYYFICVSERTAGSIGQRASASGEDAVIRTYDAYAAVDEDKVNLLGKYRPPGSGQRWFGDEFSVTRQRAYNMSLPDVVPESQVSWIADFAGRSDNTTSVSVDLNGNKVSKTIGGVSTGNGEADFGRIVRLSGTYQTTGDVQNAIVSYPQGSGPSSGWLDFIEVQGTCDLRYKDTPLQFRSLESRMYETVRYSINGLTGSELIWDITDPQRPVEQEYQFNPASGRFEFVVSTDSALQEFIVFTPGNGYSSPAGIANVPNQNLHGLFEADLVIVYHPDFEDAVMRLANHRLAHNGYLVESIPIGAIMNEFAGGGNDVTAIRDFARMLNSRSQRFKFLLLFGDGSYDIRHLNTDQADENFIPVFETQESMNPIRSFPSDDYFALLSDDEGADLRGAIDISVGRIPVSSLLEANQVVDKLIHYDSSPSVLGDWRLSLAYVADDEDGNQHLLQTEDVANTQQDGYPVYNQRKIYLDAYQQVITPGGQRYPDVNSAINDAVQNGSLILNYFGHGGPAGWSQERVLGNADIQSWTNYNRLPVIITATCSFTAYDEPSLRSAGELVLLNPAGGGIALLTTVRAVYSSDNKRLTSEVFERILLENTGSAMALGEVMMLAKNANHTDTVNINARKFALIGDPSMRLSIPENDIVVTSVNGTPVSMGIPDTARALEQVQIAGEVRDETGSKLSQFNGLLSVTVFDKPVIAKTLANDERSYEKEFETQTRVLFKGTATVAEGSFSVTFVIPQDIAFQYGTGKISLYAQDGATDASGYFADLIIGGGTAISTDNEGPVVQVYADHEGFVSGDETGPNPTMLIRLRDDSGINIAGSSIGHNLEGVLDDDSHSTYILNDLYIATVDDHTSGQVTLPLSGLSPGLHTFKVTAWDIANNFSEAEIAFRVVENPANVVRNLRNGPNPFITGTEFAFEHQLGNVPIDVTLEIYTSTGVMVRALSWPNVIAQGAAVSGLQWDGTTFGGARVLPGIYLYKVWLTSRPGTSREQLYESKCRKLIVVN